MKYHAFLSYNSKNYENAEKIYEYLSNSGLKIFFDKKEIRYGDRFQRVLENALRDSASILVIIGPQGVGPWQEEENYIGQLLNIGNESEKPFIPILLPGACFEKDSTEIPLFLHKYHRFSFSGSIDEETEMFELIQQIPRHAKLDGKLERPFLLQEQDSLLSQCIDFYSENSELYFSRWRENVPVAPMYAFIEESRKRQKEPVILDAGCGPGHHAEFFGKENLNVTGIDLCPQFIKLANKNKVKAQNFVIGDMRNLQSVFKARNLFDGVWACGSCVHTPKESIDRQLYEYLAVLKPNGVLGISLQVDAPSTLQKDGRFFERYTEKNVETLLERIGFEIVNINTQINRHSTEDKRKVKMWYNVTAVAPVKKEVVSVIL